MARSRIAEELADEERARVVAMTPAQRVELALRLGAESVRLYMQVHGVTREQAHRELDALGRIGRRPCSWDR